MTVYYMLNKVKSLAPYPLFTQPFFAFPMSTEKYSVSTRRFITKKDLLGGGVGEKVLQLGTCRHGKPRGPVCQNGEILIERKKKLRRGAVTTIELHFQHRVLPVGFFR